MRPEPGDTVTATAVSRSGASRLADGLELTKPRVTFLVVITTAVGFFVGSGSRLDPARFVHTVLGTLLVAAGASVLNQVLEREQDARMLRTRNRPLPSGRLEPAPATVFGGALGLAGLLQLWIGVNPLTCLLAALTALSYLFAYTPLKTMTSLCTLVGAIPGALPALMGFTAAQGTVTSGGLALFAILFVWQIPHSLAIAWMYREDYERGGFALLSVVDPGGGSTGRQIVSHSLVLIPVSLAPAALGIAGSVYFFGALVLSLGFLAFAVPMVVARSMRSARRLLLASVIYLPLLLALLAVDRIVPP